MAIASTSGFSCISLCSTICWTIRSKLTHSPAMPHFLSLLHHSLLLPLDYGASPQHWLLFDRIVQQIVLQSEMQENPDVEAIAINVKEIIEM